jgi:hypothetical protein
MEAYIENLGVLPGVTWEEKWSQDYMRLGPLINAHILSCAGFGRLQHLETEG